MFSQLCLCSTKWICFCCQVFQIWLLIQWVVGLVVTGSVGRWSVVDWLVCRWFVDLMKPRKKYVWSGDFACAIWSRFILFFYFYFFLYWWQRKSKFECQKQSEAETVWKFSLVLWGYILEMAKVFHIIFRLQV